MIQLRHSLPFLLLGACAPTLLAQDAESLGAAVEAYFAEADDGAAEQRLVALLARDDAKPETLLSLVRTPPPVPPGETRFVVPHHGLALVCTLRVPPGHDRTKAPLPVLCDISRGTTPYMIDCSTLIVTYVEGYTPPQFSDEARDAFPKVARQAAFLANGKDLWLSGYSWAAHACYDSALHRPGILRGIAPSGGGPRRVHFRSIANLQGLRILAYCGAQDDPELVWNLRELDRRKQQEHLDYTLTLDPAEGHNYPIADFANIASRILATKPIEPADEGTLIVDSDHVENPRVRCVLVDPKRVTVPERIPVRASLDPDGKRRATIAAMDSKVATVPWSIDHTGNAFQIVVQPNHVKTLHVFLRADDAALGNPVEIKSFRKTVHKGPATIDARVLLEEARRTRERSNPTIQRFVIER